METNQISTTGKQIEQDLIEALKSKQAVVVESLRNLKAELKNTQIAKQHELSEPEVLEVLKRKVKQHKDSIESFAQGGRQDLVAHEQQQMAVLQKYLPPQMSEEEVSKLVKAVITELNATAQDFGKVMKEVLSRAPGGADGSVVSRLVKAELK